MKDSPAFDGLLDVSESAKSSGVKIDSGILMARSLKFCHVLEFFNVHMHYAWNICCTNFVASLNAASLIAASLISRETSRQKFTDFVAP